MKEIIWVYGTSASGKETFIKRLLSDEETKKGLGIDGRTVVACDESFKNLGKLDESRISVVSQVSSLLESSHVVIIKWQYGDTLLGSPNKLRAQYPTLRHRAIALRVDEDEQVRRLRTKLWWHDVGQERQFIAKELALVDESIQKLDPDFIVIEFGW